jgi:hypothetical protein
MHPVRSSELPGSPLTEDRKAAGGTEGSVSALQGSIERFRIRLARERKISLGSSFSPRAPGPTDQTAMGVEWMICSIGLFVDAPFRVILFVSPREFSRAVQV